MIMEDSSSSKMEAGNSLVVSRSSTLFQNKNLKCTAENFAETQNIFHLGKGRAIFSWSAVNSNVNDQSENVESYCDFVVLEQIRKLINLHSIFSIFFSNLSPHTTDKTVGQIIEKSKNVLDQVATMILKSRRECQKREKLISLESQLASRSIDLQELSKEIQESPTGDESTESLLKAKAKYLKRAKLFSLIGLRLMNSFSIDYAKDEEIKEIHRRLSHVDSLQM